MQCNAVQCSAVQCSAVQATKRQLRANVETLGRREAILTMQLTTLDYMVLHCFALYYTELHCTA